MCLYHAVLCSIGCVRCIYLSVYDIKSAALLICLPTLAIHTLARRQLCLALSMKTQQSSNIFERARRMTFITKFDSVVGIQTSQPIKPIKQFVWIIVMNDKKR